MIFSVRRAVEFWQADITPDPAMPDHFAAAAVDCAIRNLVAFCMRNGFDLETWQSGRLGTVRIICRSKRAGEALEYFANARRIKIQHHETFVPMQIRDKEWVCDKDGWRKEE